MTKRANILFFFMTTVIFFQSCNKESNNTTIHNSIAQVGTKQLFMSDVKEKIPQGILNNSDSAAFIESYIRKWVTNQLLIENAKATIDKVELKRIEDKVDQFRQDLIIHHFKESRTPNVINKDITQQEIETYYNKHSKLFTLKSPIVQVEYIIFPEGVKITRMFKRQLTDESEKAKIEKEDFIYKYAKKYDNFENQWIYFNQIKNSTQLTTTNDQEYLKKNKIIELETETEQHVVVINKYMYTNQQAPISFVESQIKSLIRNQRKLDFLREIKDSLYNDGLKYNKFTVSKF